MSLMEKAQNWFRNLIKPAGESEQLTYTQLAGGGKRGFIPPQNQTSRNPFRKQKQPDAAPANPFSTQMPVTPLGTDNGYGQQPVMEQQEYAYASHPMYQPEQQSFAQHTSFQSAPQAPFAPQSVPMGFETNFVQPPMANQPGSPFEGYNNVQPLQQPSAPLQQSAPIAPVHFLNNHVVDKNGKSYRHALRVAQITTVPDCYRLIEFMRGSETVLINLDAMSEAEEMGRCLDLLYGAAYALQCTFTRVANKSLYLITPSDILVQPYDSIGEMTDREIDYRWPDPASVAYMQRNAAPREQRFAYQDTGFASAYNAPASGHADYARFQGRAVNQSQNTGYTDFGGFGGLRR